MTGTSEKMLMNKLYKEYGLSPDHVFEHKFYKIITRAGVDKIQAAANIKVKYLPIESFSSPNNGIFTIKAIGTRYDTDGKEIATVETFGEASPANTSNSYPIAMAEKRAMSRAVLKLAGLYEEGVFSEDEADDFGKAVKAGRANNVTYKGS